MNEPIPLILLALIVAACVRPPATIPEHSRELRVATCSESLYGHPDAFDQPLRSASWRLFLTADLEGPLGSINGDIAYGRYVTDDVWAILVHDFNREVCEGYVSAESVELVDE